MIQWLLKGDPSIAFQTFRDLLGQNRPDLQERIPQEGWGKAFLEARNADGSWGEGFYRPMWTSSHYTLLDLKALCFPSGHPTVAESLNRLLNRPRSMDGGIAVSPGDRKSDVCINALFLSYAAYFGTETPRLEAIVDFLLGERMADGGFNCMRNRSGADVSSLHSTLSVIEGFSEYLKQGHSYRSDEVTNGLQSATETILARYMFRSHRTGEIIKTEFLNPVFPARWKYNTLRAFDTFRSNGTTFDARMTEALAKLVSLRKPGGYWLRAAAIPGKVHVVMEPPRRASRWVTLIAMRILKTYGENLQVCENIPPLSSSN
ncbi:hypothetical protein [Roseibium sediminicola]|uniref:Squalene cyclase C-terminal domain-containing protein n=1 Tax=Roseibium sediminicola TaxID=2933272 RepID=A0ABT0GTJ7_9HYPH|nr:hypothetical protein [Roseibium sp. CAU 1639]MCK7612758.1 hypothetical protein [Roseibium sp. CAU 1639]